MASICFVAGDPSGDTHAARLVEALRDRHPSLTYAGLGGPAMQKAGVSLLDDLTQTAAIGPFDALRHVPRLRRAARLLEDHLKNRRPDLAVLVDFGDFNLPVIAPLVKRYRVPILYYISPQLWAWGRIRLRYIRRHIDRMAVLFRFEEAFYQDAGVPVTWVGHPLIDTANPSLSKREAATSYGLNPSRMTVGLLPGSRTREVQRHLPLMLAAARHVAWRMPGVQFLIQKPPGVSREAFAARLAGTPVAIHIAEGPIVNALQLMEGAIVTSGTATIETAVAGVPMVVVYRVSWPTYLIARAVVRIPRIAMVNIIGGREVVPECLQHRARSGLVADRLVTLLRDTSQRAAMKASLREVTDALGPPGAVGRAADVVLEMLGATAAEGTSSVRSP